MSERLKGKVALLTAAAAGIGRATAQAFHAEGARVIATDLDAAKLEGLPGELRKLDVRSTEAVEALAREVGPIDVLFNCAGLRSPRLGARVLRQRLGFLVRSQCEIDASHDPRIPAGHAGKGGGSIVNVASGGLLGARHPQSLRLRRFESRGDRADQGRGGRFHQARHALQRDLPRHHREPFARSAHRDAGQRRPDQSVEVVRQAFVDRQPMGRLGERRRRSPRWRSISPRTRVPTPPAKSTWRTAASPCRASRRQTRARAVTGRSGRRFLRLATFH